MSQKNYLPTVTVKNRVRNYEKKIKNAMNKEPVLVRKKKIQKPEKKEVKKPKKKKIPKKKKQPDTTKLLMKLAKDLEIKINKTNVEMETLKRMIRKRLRSLYKK